MKLMKIVFKKVIKNSQKNNELILIAQKIFKSKKHNAFTEEINKIALSSNDNRKMSSFDSRETYSYGTRKDLVSEKEDVKCSNI